MTNFSQNKIKLRDLFILQEGLGDAVAFTALCEPYFRHFGQKILVAHKCPELFEGNPFCEIFKEVHQDSVSPQKLEELRNEGFNPIFLTYCDYRYNAALPGVETVYQNRHMIETMGERLGLSGKIISSPHIFLTPEEVSNGNRSEKRQIVVSAKGKTPFKTCNPSTIREVCNQLLQNDCFTLFQVGQVEDELISENIIDLRGKTSVRETAAILANSILYIGPLGFNFHLAHAMHCPAAVLFPQSEPLNLALYADSTPILSPTRCNLCEKENLMLRDEPCPYNYACIRAISSKQIMKTVQKILEREKKEWKDDVWNLSPAATPIRDMSLYDVMLQTRVPKLELFFAETGEIFSEQRHLALPIYSRENLCKQTFHLPNDGHLRRFRVDFNPEPNQFYLIRQFDFIMENETVFSLENISNMCFVNLITIPSGRGLFILPINNDPHIVVESALQANIFVIQFETNISPISSCDWNTLWKKLNQAEQARIVYEQKTATLEKDFPSTEMSSRNGIPSLFSRSTAPLKKIWKLLRNKDLNL